MGSGFKPVIKTGAMLATVTVGRVVGLWSSAQSACYGAADA